MIWLFVGGFILFYAALVWAIRKLFRVGGPG